MPGSLEQHDASALPVASLRPRLLVYETPSAEDLLEVLGKLFSDLTLDLQVPGCRPLVDDRAEPDVVRVWHLGSLTRSVMEQTAQTFLHDFAYPLAASGTPFVLSFPFPKNTLAPRELSIATIGALDIEDIAKLLAPDTIAEHPFDMLHLLASRLALTPIELALEEALHRHDVRARPQVRVGPYIVDFLVESNGSRVAVEADGAAFHDVEQDAARDRQLLSMGIDQVVRFTGSEIFRDADACAEQVAALLNGSQAAARMQLRREPLDESQMRAVDHRHGQARVVAPAGAGKTRVLVERIAELVSRGVEPSSILALAFNRKANDQLVSELTARNIPVSDRKLFGGAGVRCATFNAFGYRYQREILGLNFQVQTEAKYWDELMAQAVKRAGVSLQGLRRGSNPIREFLRARERACADLADPSELEVELVPIQGEPRVVGYGPVDEEFERLRIGRQVQSFDDQLATTIQALLQFPDKRAFAQQYFSHVLVDEFQDLNAAQLALVDIVSRPLRNVFVVGDDDQLIYGWRYADLTNILGFEERMPAASTYVLSTNYRSSVAIVDASSRVIENNSRRVSKDIRPAAGASVGQVRYAASKAHEERTEALLEFVTEQKNACGQWRELAVLCRYKAQQPLVAMVLDSAGIPRTPLLQYRLFSDKDIRLLRAYVDVVLDPSRVSGDALALIVNRPNRFATNELVHQLAVAEQPWDALCFFLDEGGADDFRVRELRGFRDRVEALHQRCVSITDPVVLLDEVIAGFGLRRYWEDKQTDSLRNQDDANPLQLVELVRLHASDCPSINTLISTWDERSDAEVKQDGMEQDSLEREDTEERDRVVISTIHASKGREYEAVVLFDYHPDLSNLAEPEIEEERRVFYVGATRARESLLVTVDRNKPLHRFVRESIAPQKTGEPDQLALRMTQLRTQAREAAIDVIQVRERLGQIADGRERKLLENEQADDTGLAAELTDQLQELDAWLVRSRFWHKLTGRRSRVAAAAEPLRAQLAVVDDRIAKRDRELALLRSEVGRYMEPFEAQLAAAEASRDSAEREASSVEDRVAQLSLLREPG